MAVNTFIANGGSWNTAANWLLDDLVTQRVPLNTDDCVFTGIIAGNSGLQINTTNAVCKSADFTTAGAAFTLSGIVQLTVYGSLTCKTGMTWSQSGNLYVARDSSGTLTSNGVNLGSVAALFVRNASLTLGDNLNMGNKDIYVFSTATLTTNNNSITCADLSDGAGGGPITLTLGSSAITTTNISFPTGLTVTANTATINLTATADTTANFGGKTWGGTTTVLMTGGKVLTLNGANSFDKFALSYTTDNILSGLVLGADQTFTNATADAFKLTGASVISRPYVKSSVVGTHRHLTAATVNVTGAVDFQDITGDGAGSWNLSAINSGNLGGNTGITFRTADDYYLDFGTANAAMTDNCWSLSSGGGAGGTGVFPLPQDTMILDNNSWDDLTNYLTVGNSHRIGKIDASALTEANRLTFDSSFVYGDLILTGSGIMVVSAAQTFTIDARVRNEATANLIINVPGSNGFSAQGVIIDSYAGTVQLAANMIYSSGSLTHTRGVFDLNGKSYLTPIYSSSNSNVRSLIDSAGGGKIVVTYTTGTIFNQATATNLTVSNSPKIDIGTSNLTLDGNVTFASGGKTFGDFKVCKHAGNYTCDITGGPTLGVFTQETPDATYQYSGARFTAATTTTVAGIVADGTSSYQITRNSITAATHTISDTTGTNTVTYNTITNEIATGGATFTSLTSAGNIDGTGNTGWTFTSGPSAGALMHHFNMLNQ